MASAGLRGEVHVCVSAVYHSVMSPRTFLYICYAKAAEKGPDAAGGERCSKVIE